MTRQMLIDASQPEETRVVVTKDGRIEDFDYDFEAKKQLKGNIYLAKVTRVEPSLQAAFVDYGGNRHGFLAFNEIHPDYYKIPIADREKLIEEEQETAHAEAGEEPEEGESVETVGGDDLEDEEKRRRRLRRRYKIQEVIKRGQIILIQVVKEERGNKGAALTTYLSLPGRYCVLMPNTARGGGISRKITNQKDRKRLKSILDSFGIPGGMTVIVRTAGSERTKAEIRRDYSYLTRLWDSIREDTLKSIAPALIYEEANLIKRAIRDLYSKEIDDVTVHGEEGYKIAKEMMRTLMPSHAKKVQPYKNDQIPLFHDRQIEGQLDSINSPEVQLRSGGYIVMHQTEALVAIDVNSGRATRERHIEETAYRTNLEAAEEIARQLRLRDLAGLIVIDFIDMEEHRNNHAVERRLKDALRADRARIQVGRISHFGLLEMSRQRLRPSLTEISSEMCPHCGGTGLIRSTEWAALYTLRAIEEEAIKGAEDNITVIVRPEAALYILNHKRAAIADIEARYDLTITVNAGEVLAGETCLIQLPNGETRPAAARPDISSDAGDSGGRKRKRSRRRKRGRDDERGDERDDERGSDQTDAQAEESDAEDQDDSGDEEEQESQASEGEQEAPRKRRRRGRRGGRRRNRRTAGDQENEDSPAAEADDADDDAENEPVAAEAEADAESDVEAETLSEQDEEQDRSKAKPKRRRRSSSRRKAANNDAEAEEEAEEDGAAETPEAETADEPAGEPDTPAAAQSDPEEDAPPRAAANEDDSQPQANNDDAPDAPKRTGWWNKVIG